MRGVSFRPVNYFLFEKRNEKKKESKGFDRVYFQTNSITFGKERDREKIDVVNFKVSLLRSGKRRGCEIDRLSDQSGRGSIRENQGNAGKSVAILADRSAGSSCNSWLWRERSIKRYRRIIRVKLAKLISS